MSRALLYRWAIWFSRLLNWSLAGTFILFTPLKITLRINLTLAKELVNNALQPLIRPLSRSDRTLHLWCHLLNTWNKLFSPRRLDPWTPYWTLKRWVVRPKGWLLLRGSFGTVPALSRPVLGVAGLYPFALWGHLLRDHFWGLKLCEEICIRNWEILHFVRFELHGIQIWALFRFLFLHNVNHWLELKEKLRFLTEVLFELDLGRLRGSLALF